jgi:hypothetical protein
MLTIGPPTVTVIFQMQPLKMRSGYPRVPANEVAVHTGLLRSWDGFGRGASPDQFLARYTPWLTGHGHVHIFILGKLFRLVIPRVHMPDHAHAGIGRQHTLDALGHHVGAVGDGDLPGVQ